MANPRTPSDDDGERIIDAAPDPKAQAITELTERSEHDAAFAELEAAFSRQEHDYSDQLAHEGREADANTYAHDAKEHMADANRVMRQAREEETAAEQLRQQQQRRLSTTLQTMHDTQLITLRDAVQSVRQAVEELTPADVSRMRRLALVNEQPVDETRIEIWRETVVTSAIRIEGSLNDPNSARHNAAHLVRDLSLFAAAAVELAKLAPQLMDILRQFGQLILQFHFG